MGAGIIRRPKADDFRPLPLVAAAGEAADLLAESSADARLGALRLLRFTGLVLLLGLLTPVFLWLPALFPQVPPALIWFGGVAFFAAAFWAHGFNGAWREKLARKRERLSAFEDTAEMRRRALALDARNENFEGGFDVP